MQVQLCLVLNKIDRLILELCLTPQEAYGRMCAIVAHVNMIVSSFQSERFISEADSVLAHEDAKAAAGTAGHPSGNEADASEAHSDDEDDVAFSPELGNVAFASAHDGWGFRVHQFAEMYAARMGCKAEALCRAMWGDYAYQPKTKRIVRIKADARGKLKPLFVQLALDPLWKAYAACDPGEDHAAVLGKMVQGLGLPQTLERAIQHSDARTALRSVLRAWLPLSEAVLGMAADKLPSPVAAAPLRVSRLLPPRADALKGFEESEQLRAALDEVEAAVASCSAEESAPTVVYVSKMVAVPANALPRVPGEPGPADPLEERFLAFGRVFSGVVRAGQSVQVLPATYNPAAPGSEHSQATVTALYLMMGRGLEWLSSVSAGNVLALAGLDTSILKSATVASTPLCRPLAPLLFQSAPIVRVAVEPAHPGDMPKLVEGLRLLHRADPLVQVAVQESGEHVVCAAGEVHLETCVKDLRERFARIELLVSPPLVAFRETVVGKEEEEATGVALPPPKVVEVSTAGGACTLRVRAVPMPAAMASALDQSADALRVAVAGKARGAAAAGSEDVGGSGDGLAASGAGGGLLELGEKLELLADGDDGGPAVAAALGRVWMLGPKRFGPNFLLAAATSSDEQGSSLWDVPEHHLVRLTKQTGRVASAAALAANDGSPDDGRDTPEDQSVAAVHHFCLNVGSAEISRLLGVGNGSGQGARSGVGQDAAAETLAGALAGLSLSRADSDTANGTSPSDSLSLAHYLQHSVESGIASGFQLASAAGPLCDESMWGVIFEVEARLNMTTPTEEGSPGPSLPLQEDVYGPFSGQLTSAARQAFRGAVMEAGPRLAEAAFLCEVSTSSDGLSAVYAVLGRRRARVLREELREGSDLFTIHAYLPAEASFGFADELRRRSSGAAAASLMLSHWERLQVDPFFVPKTEEEREEYGEEGQGVGAPNLARRLVDSVRRRKGLQVEEKVVESATRQRTRARKV